MEPVSPVTTEKVVSQKTKGEREKPHILHAVAKTTPTPQPPQPLTTATTTAYNALLEQQIKTSFLFSYI